jgi:hypothetical protein
VRTDENAGKEEPRRDWEGRGAGRRHLEGQWSCGLEAGQPGGVGAATRGTAGAAAWRPAAWELLAGSLRRGEAGPRRLEEQLYGDRARGGGGEAGRRWWGGEGAAVRGSALECVVGGGALEGRSARRGWRIGGRVARRGLWMEG